MSDASEIRDDLIRVRDGYLMELVGLARDRKKGEAILVKFRQIERTIVAYTGSRYGEHKTALQAILDYLEEIDRPATAQEIEDSLCDGGFRGGGEKARTNIRRSLSAWHNNKQLKRVGDLIGKADWEKARFKRR